MQLIIKINFKKIINLWGSNHGKSKTLGEENNYHNFGALWWSCKWLLLRNHISLRSMVPYACNKHQSESIQRKNRKKNYVQNGTSYTYITYNLCNTWKFIFKGLIFQQQNCGVATLPQTTQDRVYNKMEKKQKAKKEKQN